MTAQRLQSIPMIYAGFDRKPHRVQLDDGPWVDAEIRARDHNEHGAWSANIS